MECRPLDITVLSAKGLKNVNLLCKMDVYVKVSISGPAGPRQSRQKTPVDKKAGTSPQWNFPMKFTLDESAIQMNHLSLVFKIMSDRILGDSVIGEVRVSLKQLLDIPAGNDKSQKTKGYFVVTPKGKKQGSLDFSYRFGDKYTYTPPAPPPAPAYAAPPAPAYGSYPAPKGAGEPAMAYPAAAGSSSAYSAYPPQGQGYAQPGYGYPPQYGQSHGYPPQYPPQSYGFPPMQRPPMRSGNMMGLGLAGGLLGGLLIGDMISDGGDMGGFDGGFGF